MSENNLMNTCVWCKISLWQCYRSDNDAMVGVDILTPEQVWVSKNVESSDDTESLVTCKPCDKSFDSDLAFITHEIEMHSISSWSEEEETKQEMEDNVKNNG